MIFLTACTGKVSDLQLEVYCPSPTEYSQEFNETLAEEITALPKTSTAIVDALGDYANLRDKLNTCAAVAEDTLRR